MVECRGNSALVFESSIEGGGSRLLNIRVLKTGSQLHVIAAIESGRPIGDFWHRAGQFEVKVSLERPVVCTVNGRPCEWSITHAEPEPLDELMSWAMSELWDSETSEAEASPSSDIGISTSAHDRCLRQLRTVGQLVSERVLRNIDRHSASLVKRMDVRTAFWAYAALLDDPTGRVEQLINVCPNVFALAGPAWPPRHNSLEHVLRAARAGAKLNALIEDALATGVARYMPKGTATVLNDDANAMIRHLPPMALDDLLALLHAPGADINDLTRAGEFRDAWAAYIAAWGRGARSLKDARRASQLGGFFSRHAVTLHQGSHFPDEILDWLDCTGAPIPGRSNHPRRILDRMHGWHRGLWELDVANDTPLRSGPRTQSAIAGIEAAQLITVGDLVAEGARMHHCVASLAADSIEGACFIYRATVLGTAITIDVRRDSDRWTLHQAAGFANRRPTIDELCVIHSWVQALR